MTLVAKDEKAKNHTANGLCQPMHQQTLPFKSCLYHLVYKQRFSSLWCNQCSCAVHGFNEIESVLRALDKKNT